MVDFALQEIDLLSFHLYPDFAIRCTLQCQLAWVKDEVRLF